MRDRSLLSGGGLGIVGSRNVDQAGEVFTRQVAKLCACNRIPVVSGGARGVDQISMTAALEAGGVTIGILAENLLKKSVERKYQHAIAEGRLLLISPYHPNARFTVGTAMGRNKLKKQLDEIAANNKPHKKAKQPSLFDVIKNIEEPTAKINQNNRTTSEKAGILNKLKNNLIQNDSSFIPLSSSLPASIYEAVLPVILQRLEAAMSSDELAKLLDVNKTQLNVWLKKAVDENKIIKLSKPVRYGRMKAEMKDLKTRTREFALRVIRLYGALPKSMEAQVIGKQLLRSGTSVGAHYREGMRARSDAEFISKIEGSLQELEESLYWMELLVEAKIISEQELFREGIWGIYVNIIKK